WRPSSAVPDGSLRRQVATTTPSPAAPTVARVSRDHHAHPGGGDTGSWYVDIPESVAASRGSPVRTMRHTSPRAPGLGHTGDHDRPPSRLPAAPPSRAPAYAGPCGRAGAATACTPAGAVWAWRAGPAPPCGQVGAA